MAGVQLGNERGDEVTRERRGEAQTQVTAAHETHVLDGASNLLKTGALPLDLDLISASEVSATLGKQALHQGLIAGIAGLLLVSMFLLAFYRVLGVIAIGALCVSTL